jgi:HK97 family phage major capsid protein
MDKKILREKAARATAAACAIRDEMKNVQEWPTEKQAAFDTAIAEASAANTEIQRLEARDTQMAQLVDMQGRYLTQPARLPEPQGETSGRATIREAFAAYRANGRRGVDAFCLVNQADAEKLHSSCLTLHREAFRVYLRDNREGLYAWAAEQQSVAPREIMALISSDDSLGGFLVPDDVQAEIIRASAGFAAIRPLARVQPTARDVLVWPKVKPHATDARYASGFGGDWKAQADVTSSPPTDQDKPIFQQERIPVHTWRPDPVQVSEELLEDSAVNIETILAQVIGETKAIDEDDKFLSGTGLGEPEGITSSGASTVNSGTAANITYGGLIDLFVALASQYRQRATWMWNSITFGEILKLKDSAGNYVILPNTLPGTLWGKPFVFHEGMQSCTTAAYKPIIFGDFSRYIIAERRGMAIKRLVESYHPNIAFAPSARVGGQVVLTQAFKIMYVSA